MSVARMGCRDASTRSTRFARVSPEEGAAEVSATARGAQERVVQPLLADRGRGTVAGDDLGVLCERHEARLERSKDQIRVAAPQICTTDAAPEERVAGEGNGGARMFDQKRNAPRRVPGRMHHANLDAARSKRPFVHEVSLHVASLGKGDAEELGLDR